MNDWLAGLVTGWIGCYLCIHGWPQWLWRRTPYQEFHGEMIKRMRRDLEQVEEQFAVRSCFCGRCDYCVEELWELELEESGP